MTKGHIENYLNDWLKGNDQAFEFILDHYYPRLMAASKQMIPAREDAEELVMNVFLKIWQYKDQLASVHKFDAYLFGILRQQIARHARKNVLLTVPIEDQLISHLGVINHPELNFQDLQLRYQLALNKLHPKQREVFLFSREEELSQQEISDKLGISVSTVNNHITSALKVLRQELKEYPTPLVMLLLGHTVAASFLA